MRISSTNNNGAVTLYLEGRFDTMATAEASKEIEQQLKTCAPVKSLVCDASKLEYISSSGLRVFLSLAKQYKDFRVIETSSDVYQVLEMTGFTKIMNVEKAMRRFSVDGCQVIGRGGVGVVYRIDDDTIIKVFREGTTIDEVQTEITMAKESFVLGMPTAISFDIVRVGSQYGLVYELLKADTLTACLKREPQRIDEFARLYASLFRHLHDIKVPKGGSIPSCIEREEEAVRIIRRYFDAPSTDLMMRIVQAIPQGDRLLHCDLQTKNAMLQNGELMLIDMGEVGYGHPIIDLGHSYSAMVSLVGDYEQIIGLPQQLANDIWFRMIQYYFEGQSADFIKHRTEQIAVVGCLRNFTWLSLSNSFPDEVIRHCQEIFAERVTKRKDYILSVCDTFKDWTLE
ncbi:MAG: STAS domain-containing protein [Salinivirgaceae bacterium]|nr:STAS domain-containing protein [Salinivirgaceae bacterium]